MSTATDIESKIEQAVSWFETIQKFTGVGGPITAAAAKALDEALLAAIAGAKGTLDPATVQAKLDALPTAFAANDAEIDADITRDFPK